MIGIVCPYKNAPKYTIDFLLSIKTKHELIVILIDDFSSLDTKDEMKKFLSSNILDFDVDLFENVQTISLSEKWNLGCKHAFENYKCDYVIVANNDVIMHPVTIDAMIDRLSKDDVSMVTAVNVRGMVQVPELLKNMEIGEPNESPHPDFSFFAINRDCWESVGQFDRRYAPAYWEDNDYHTRIIYSGRTAISTTAAPYFHYGSITSDMDESNIKHETFQRNRRLFLHKFGGNPEEVKLKRLDRGKKKILALGDFTVETGMGRFMHETMNRIKDSGQFDIAVVGVNYHGEPHPLTKKFDVYPADLYGDLWGKETLRSVYQNMDPDIVFLFQDHWNLYRLLEDVEGANGIVLYYPLDSKNLMPNYIYRLSNAAAIACPTEFAIQETMESAKFIFNNTLKQLRSAGKTELTSVDVNLAGRQLKLDLGSIRQMTNRDFYSKIYHGVDVEKFYPMDKSFCREKLGLPKNKFIVGYVGRNQFRKNPYILIQALAEMNDKDVVLVMHTELTEEFNLPQYAELLGVRNQVIFSRTLFDWTDEDPTNLRMLYNSFDVMVNVSGGEGWGFTVMEGAACAVPQIVPNYSATGEIWKDHAILLVNGTYSPTPIINTIHFTPDKSELADRLKELKQDRKMLSYLGDKAFRHANDPKFNWDYISEKMLQLFNNYAYFPKQSIPVTVNYEYPPTLTKFRKKENEDNDNTANAQS